MQTESLDKWINQSAEVLNGSSNLIPRAFIGSNNSLISDRFIEDASYVRLKNLTLGYTLPKSVLNVAGIEFIKIYATAQNLLTLTEYSGYDPEVSISGPLNIDYGAYPNSRYFGGGISVGF